jgi:hypothetical protein
MAKVNTWEVLYTIHTGSHPQEKRVVVSDEGLERLLKILLDPDDGRYANVQVYVCDGRA